MRVARVLQVYRDYFTTLHGGIERHIQQLAHGMPAWVQSDVVAGIRRGRSRTMRDGDVAIHLTPEWTRLKGVPI